MKKTMQGLLSLLFIAALVSCGGNPFIGSAFDTVDVYVPPSLDDASADDIVSEAGNDEFFESLEELEETEIANIIDTLEESLPEDASAASAEDQETALVLAEVQLAATGADDTVANISGLLNSFLSEDEGDGEGEGEEEE